MGKTSLATEMGIENDHEIVNQIIKKYENHPSIKGIKNNRKNDHECFSFCEMQERTVKNQLGRIKYPRN